MTWKNLLGKNVKYLDHNRATFFSLCATLAAYQVFLSFTEFTKFVLWVSVESSQLVYF